MATVVHGPTGAVVAIMLGSLSTAFGDVIADSIVVERARGGPQVASSTHATWRLISLDRWLMAARLLPSSSYNTQAGLCIWCWHP